MSDTATSTHTTGAAHFAPGDFQKALDQTKKDSKPLVVDFYADWCGPCQLAAPIIEKLGTEYASKAVIAKLNVDEINDVAGEQGVMSIPTVIIYKNGEEVDRKIGFPGEQGYREMIERAINQEG